MLNLGVNLMIYGFVGALLTNLIMLIRFVSSAKEGGPAITQIFHSLFLGTFGEAYLKLLQSDGIEATTFDELIYRVNIILMFTAVLGLVLVAFGLLTTP
jgi:hypothetical protein